MERKEKDIVLIKGSKYRIKSIESRERPLKTHGTFEGYTAVGRDEAIAIRLDESHKEQKGRMRIIPIHMILAIDVVEVAKEGKKEEEPSSRMFR